MKKALLLATLALPVAALGLAGCSNTEPGKAVKSTNSSVGDVSRTTNQTLNTADSAESTGKRLTK
jgi:outer membrane lipoprotein-sorting protein